MSKFKVGQKVKRVRDHDYYTLFRYNKYDAVFTVSNVSDEGIRLKECAAQTWYDDGKFELYQGLVQKTFIPASSNNPVVIPQENSDLSFQVKALELENLMLRMLLRQKGVDV